MKKVLTTILLVTLVLSLGAFAQTKYNYTYVKNFPNDAYIQPSGAHGVAVDPEGKVWIQPFTPAESLNVGGIWRKLASIHVYNANGTPAAFSPIQFITVSGVKDTLFAGNNRGMNADKDGNIVIAQNLAGATGRVYRLNYKTGAGMKKVIPTPVSSPTAPAFDNLNEMFIGYVSPDVGPIHIFDANFSSLGNVRDTSKGYSRTLAVSADGNDVLWCGFTNSAVYKYHSANGSIGPYSVTDTVMKGLTAQAIARHPKTGYFWVGSGDPTSGSNQPPYINYTYYAFAPPNYTTPIDSFKWQGIDSLDEPRPRAIAFTSTGDTVYVAAFNVAKTACVQMFKKGTTGVKQNPGVATTYSLDQNYPNPFNPSTEIKFSVNTGGQTALRVYDVLGKEVSTLVNERLNAGSYSVTFDAAHLPSGTYFYTLSLDGRQISKKMMLLK